MPVISIHRYRSTSRLLALLCCTALTGVVLSVASAMPAKAQQVWVGINPGDDFNSGANWDTDTVPGSGDTAAFRDNGAATNLSTSFNTQVGALQFDAGAPSFTITLGDDLTFNGSGPGIINNSGGEQTIVADGHVLYFLGGTTAGSATLRAVNEGGIYFRGTSDGGTSTIDLENGLLLVNLASGGLEIGALQGSGRVTFGLNATDQYLTVGNLNTDTTFAGRISEQTDVTGSLIKVGTGTLTLSGNNAYSGGTTINAGTVLAASDNALGSGLVTLGGGTLALTGERTLNNDIDLAAAGTIRIDAGVNGTLNGRITTNGRMLTLNTLGTGTINGDIDGSTSLIDKTGSGTLTINGVVSGTGAGVMAGSGTLVLNNANTYGGGSGSTVIGNATLVVGHDQALSTSRLTTNSAGSVLSANKDVSLVNNVSLVDGHGLTVDTAGHAIGMSGVFQTIGGSAPITKTGAGTLMLSGNNSGFTGDAVVSEGTLGITGQLGSDAGTVDYTGADSAATATMAVAGTGSTWNLSGNLSVGESGTGRLNITDRGTVTNFRGIIGYHEGSRGRATVTGAGSVWTTEMGLLIGRSGAGDLVVSDGGTVVSNSPWGDRIAANRGSVGTVRIEGPDSSWNSTLLQVATHGTGTLTLADGGAIYSANDVWIALYSGSTGTLNIGAGEGEAAAAAGVIAASSVNFGEGIGSLVFNHTETHYVFSTGLQSTSTGTHALDHIAGTTSLTGDSSGFSGTTTISGGTLLVNNRLGGTALVKGGGTLIVGGNGHAGAAFAGDVSVDTGGSLGGVGTIDGNATVAGTIAPGNSIGTLTIDGDITFEAGSIYLAEINPALESDLIDASGVATINGGTVHAVKAGGVYTPGSRWTIVGADGGVTGTFDDLTQNMPFVDLALAYDANNIYIDATRNEVAFCDAARTANQCSTGAGLESAGVGNPVYDAVAALADEDSARHALDSLSGEVHASAKSALIEDSRLVRDAINDRIRSAFGDMTTSSVPIMAYGPDGTKVAPATARRLAVWGQAFGSWGSFDRDGNAASFDHDTGGMLMGMDGFVAENWRLGFLAGYSYSSFDAKDRASSGSSDNYHIGLYAGTEWGKLGFRSGLAYSWHDIETNRSVSFPGFADRLTGDYDAGTFQAFGEFGYKIDTAVASFEPFANLAYVNHSTDAFIEKGGAAALHSQSQSTDVTFTTLGLRAAAGFDLGGIKATARGMLGWRHGFGNNTSLATHAFAGSDAFTVAGTPIAEDAAVIETRLDLNLTEIATLGIAYQGQVASGARQHGFKAKLNVKFYPD